MIIFLMMMTTRSCTVNMGLVLDNWAGMDNSRPMSNSRRIVNKRRTVNYCFRLKNGF